MENRESLKNKNNILKKKKKKKSTIIAFPIEIVMYRNKRLDKIHPLLLEILRVKNYQNKIKAKNLKNSIGPLNCC